MGIRIAIIAVVIAALGVAAWFAVPYLKMPGGEFFGKGTSAYVSLGKFSPGLLHAYVQGEVQAEPYAAMSDGKRVLVTDIAGTSERRFAIGYESEDPLALQVYRFDGEGILTKLTTSATVKRHLSYDAASDTLAYAVRGIGDVSELFDPSLAESVVVLPGNGGAEQEVGPGTEPALMQGGQALLAREGSALRILGRTGARLGQLNLAPSSPFAFDAGTGTVVVYNPLTASLDYFHADASGSASYERSQTLEGMPGALVAYEGVVYRVDASSSQGAYAVSRIGTESRIDIANAVASTSLQDLILIHD